MRTRPPSPALLSRTTDAELDRVFNKRMLALTLASQSPQYRDMGEVSVWDLILAKRADTLSTCTACFYDEQGRDRVKVCDKCAWQGSFASLSPSSGGVGRDDEHVLAVGFSSFER